MQFALTRAGYHVCRGPHKIMYFSSSTCVTSLSEIQSSFKDAGKIFNILDSQLF